MVLTIYNVGQGDSMLLTSMASTTCCFDREPLLIDCGLQKAKVHSMIGATPKTIRVLITHADGDHIGGLYDVLAKHQVSRLYVPRYLPEMLRIEDYLRKKAARKLPKLPKVSAGRRIEVAEGDFLCSHSLVMNPPKLAKNVLEKLGVEDVSRSLIERAVTVLREHGLELDADKIMNYVPEPIDAAVEADGDPRSQSAKSHFRERRKFFRGFFIYLARHLETATDTLQVDAKTRDDFAPTGNPATDRAVSDAISFAANQVSIVFRYDGSTSILFTGDADTSVFARIKSHGHPLQADYLKVPHHGSRHNLDAASLAEVAPKIAVISHGNRRFARDPDSHPHMDTINLLNSHGVVVHYTNDVKKSGKVIAKAAKGSTPGKHLYFPGRRTVSVRQARRRS